jgi:hypothetical protein
MSNEIKLVYPTGRKVTYIIRQPDGALRGPADRPLTESPPSSGYYINNDSPDLVVRDMIIIKDNEAGVNVAYGEWKPEDATPAKGGWKDNFFWKLYEKTLKVIVDAVLERVWPKQ